MDISQIENNIEALLNSYTEENFIYGLLTAYALPNAAVTRLRNGEYNLSKDKNQILWKKRICYQVQKSGDLHSTIDELKKSPAIIKQHPRFLIVTDFTTLLAIDTVNPDTLDIPLQELSRHFDFFLPWAGMEKSQLLRENPADIKAAERMGRLYDLILEEDPIKNEEQRHSLNVFFTRLLFCYFAEDTGIFPSGIFVNGIASHTSEDGSDLQSYLSKVFEILNQEKRKTCPAFLSEYPYVNGGLFATHSPAPKFNAKSRKLLIECGALNWKEINPDIFGSMMQAVVHSDERSGKGMHYTSVVNIMKVIEPLFLNDLREELARAGDNKQKLEKLLERIYQLRIFDPACGSGNFLIIAYKELCKMEIEIFKQLDHGQMSFNFQNKIKINQFYGIEIDDFAHETAKLSLWLAEHQMNLAFREVFGSARPTLPLQDGGNIVCGNATLLDWRIVCPISDNAEFYILGNPPYLGSSMQSSEQKSDMAKVFKGIDSYKNLDYISCWFVKGCEFITGQNVKLAFVSTNSICQGEQVELLWPSIFKAGIEIKFAYQSFRWSNNARGNAGVTCVIIGLGNLCSDVKYLINKGIAQKVKSINAYLSAGENVIIKKRKKPISKLPILSNGNKAVDSGNLLLSKIERDKLLAEVPSSVEFIKPIVGAHEFLNGVSKYCLWITDEKYQRAKEIPNIKARIERVKNARTASSKKATKEKAGVPYQFGEIRYTGQRSLFVPAVSSERRKYLPIGFLQEGVVTVAPNFAVFDPPPYLFAVLSSRMHLVWILAVAGRLETRIRYSSALCYNTFPIPELSNSQLTALEDLTFRILDERELYPEKTIAHMYDPLTMPLDLSQLHQECDLLIDQCYRKELFKNDEDRLEFLFKLYSRMLSEELSLGGQACQISST